MHKKVCTKIKPVLFFTDSSQTEEWKDLELQPVTSSISYGYYNVLPVSQRGATVDDQQLDETSSESTIYAKAQSPTLPPQEAEHKQEPNSLPRQNGLMPVMVFPRRKDSKFFQFSLPKHKFQRVQPGTTQ